MAIQKTIRTQFGEDRECYIRINNIEVSNHGQPAKVLFRGFLCREAYQEGAHYVAEFDKELLLDVAEPLWPQAYAALKAEPEFTGAADC